MHQSGQTTKMLTQAIADSQHSTRRQPVLIYGASIRHVRMLMDHAIQLLADDDTPFSVIIRYNLIIVDDEGCLEFRSMETDSPRGRNFVSILKDHYVQELEGRTNVCTQTNPGPGGHTLE